ncbi:hypothetical protein ACEN2J_07210 [Pseudorhodobacter sp. W20_MBD10_FR17]|uniref:hypothetical protein n=1 Tax=Pseudorhodobacter sp. W20_MBD10_FR17 TaxID=3240266 RepID=UPI003F98CFBA
MTKLFGAACLFICMATVGFGGPSGFASTEKPHLPPAPSTPEAITVAQQEQSFQAYLTGYSFWDNTPPGSAAIARPVIHRRAGGTGTYGDPITIAVGYRLVNGSAQLDFRAGTRFYIPALKRYAIVEDICGDGNQPHLTGCHRGKNGAPWLDIYVGGQSAGRGASNACMRRITGMKKIIMNPRKGYAVEPGALSESGCGGKLS